MRIGFYSPTYPGASGVGGIGTYTRTLARALATRGHEVHVLTPGAFRDPTPDGPVLVHPTRQDHLPGVDRLVPGAGACWRVARSMRRLALRHRLDLVEFPNWEGLGLGYATWASTPVVVRLSTSSLNSARIEGKRPRRVDRWDFWRERRLARSARALVTHSRSHRLGMAEETGLDPDRIEVVPLGVETRPDFVRTVEPGRPLTVLSVGRLERRKGTLDLLLAWPDVAREVPGARLVFIGNDRPHCPGGRTHARFVADELPAEAAGRVDFLGPLDDDEVDRRLRSADLFVSPALYESFGLTFLEAMRWGTPVVGTRAGAIPEVVEDGRSGALVDPGRADQLASAMIAILRDEGRRKRLGEAGRARVEATFSAERMATENERVYLRLLGGCR